MKKKVLIALKICGGIMAAFLILALILIVIEHNNSKDDYQGNQNPISGEWCDYSFHIKNRACCDEDDHSCEVCTHKDYDCKDFPNQEKAQSVYDECKDFNPTIKDIYNLDSDNDEIACESLQKE